MGGRGCAGREKESALSCRRERKTHRRPVFWPPPCCCGDAAATTTWPAQVLEGLLAWMLGMQDSDMAILVMFFYTRRTLSDFFFSVCTGSLLICSQYQLSPTLVRLLTHGRPTTAHGRIATHHSPSSIPSPYTPLMRTHSPIATARRAAVALLFIAIGFANASHPAAKPGSPTASNAVITWQKAAQEAVQVCLELHGRPVSLTGRPCRAGRWWVGI